MAIQSKSHAEFIAQVSNDVSPRGPWQIKHNQCSYHDVSYRFRANYEEPQCVMLLKKSQCQTCTGLKIAKKGDAF